VQNMEGAGGVRAANHVYAIAPKDGTVIAGVNQGAAMFQLLGGKGAQYDPAKFQWLGSMAYSNNTVYVWHKAGVNTIEEAKAREVTMAGSGVISDANIYPAILNALVGTKFKVINGYAGTNESNLALERGEVDLAIGHLPDMGADFYQQRLFLERYVCLVGPDHPLLDAQGRLSKRRFLQASHAVVLPSGTGHNLVEQTLTELGLAERIALKVQNFLVLPAIVRSTDLVALVPRSVAESLAAQDTVHFVPAPITLPEFVVKQCWHARYHHDAGNQWLRQQIAQLFTRGPR